MKISGNTQIGNTSYRLEDLTTTNFQFLGQASNQDVTINLTNDKLSNYKYIAVVSGWGLNKSTTMIPTSLFSGYPSSFKQCMQYVKTYNGNAYTSISYISDTSFAINGAITGTIGTDTETSVFGIK